MSPVEQRELDEFLEENLCTGQIRSLKSLMASLVFFIKKKDGKLRFVQDYQKLNTMTVKNTYLLPLILDIINKIVDVKAKYFTKLDEMYVGDIKMCKSKRGMNGKWPSKRIEDSSNPWSCTLASPPVWLPSKP